jgi:hypothetical protein
MFIAVVAFLCGVIVGGVAVALQRAAAIERIKQQFRAELEAVLIQGQDVAPAPNEASPKQPKPSGGYDPGRAA